MSIYLRLMNTYESLIKNGKYQQVVDELTKLLATDNYNTEALIWLAKAQFKLDLYPDSIDTYSKLINLLPGVADLYADRGLCYHLAGEVKLALTDFDKAVELEPKNAYRYSCRAFVKNYYKDYQGALADYNKAIEIDPEDAIAYNNKGMLEEKLGFEEQANQSYNASDQLQGIDLDKELAKINTKDALPITLPTTKPKTLTKGDYFSVLKTVFTSKQGFNEFVRFLTRKRKSS